MLDKSDKNRWREEVEDSLNKSSAFFVASYSGMTVEQLSSMRRELKKVNSDFCVIKNTISRKALEKREESITLDLFKGQTGIVFAYGEAVAAAKAASECAKKFDKFNVLGGYMEKSLLTTSAITNLASLPSREVLIGKLLSTLVSPHRGLLQVLNGVSGNLVRVLAAIKDKKAS